MTAGVGDGCRDGSFGERRGEQNGCNASAVPRAGKEGVPD